MINNKNHTNVVCISCPFDNNRPLDHLYKIGHIYKSIYFFDRVLISDNGYLEFEWVVYCSDHNHYQFTNSDYDKYFIDVSEVRDKKIEELI